MNRMQKRIILATIILLALCGSVQAGLNVWTGDGPFPQVSGQRAVHALAISSDGTVIYSGLNSGTVMSLTFGPTPVVSSIAPATGPAAGVTTVTITGTGFTGALGAAFDGTPGTNFTVLDSTHITVDSPAHIPGTGHVRVISPGSMSAETSADIFTWTGDATRLFVSAASPQTAGTPFDFTVTALDALGNRVSDYAGLVHFSSSDGSPTLPADYTFITADAGSHTFASGATLTTAGYQTISANQTPGDTVNGNSSPIRVTAGTATHFSVTVPAAATSGSPIGITVTALDAYGNTATGYTGTVGFTSSDSAASLPAGSTLTNGVGSFSVTLNTAGTQTITATDTVTGTITGDSAGIDVGPGAVARFAVTASATATAGTPLTVLTVTAIDAAGNTNTGYTGTVHFSGSDATATYPADYTFVPGDAGVHSFASEAMLRTAGTQFITATDTAATPVTGTSGTITVSPGPVTHLTITAPATAAVEYPVDFEVTAADDYENTVTGYTGTMTFASSDSAATLPGASTLTSGRGTFPATFMTTGIQTITATGTDGPSTITGTSGDIRVIAATHFSVSAPPSATTGLPLTFTVTVLDESNNPVTGYMGTVHFTSSDSAATLPAYTALTGGTGSFTAILRTLGPQTITATGPAAAPITGTSGTIAVGAVPTAGPTTLPSSPEDPFPSSGTGSGSGNTGGTGNPSDLPLMTVTVNIGGDSNAWQAIVTGTKLSELIVTGTEQHGSANGCNPPAGPTFQYLSLSPARYGTITNAVINFTIPQSWLDANTIAPGSVVLYSMTPDCWKPLPTTYLGTRDGSAYFSGQSTGFSQFAITGTPDAAVSPYIVMTRQAVAGDGVQPPAPAAAGKAPAPTQTTAPPAPEQAPAGSSPFPVVPVFAVLACIGLISGGWYARRWWIRRQNPALFRDYD